MNNWDRMRAGKLYNADSADIAGYHEKGMGLCDKFNRTPIWMKKRKQRILEKMIPSAKDGGACIFAPFYCEYGVNIHFGKGCFLTTNVHFWIAHRLSWVTEYGLEQMSLLRHLAIRFCQRNACRRNIRTASMTLNMQSL